MKRVTRVMGPISATFEVEAVDGRGVTRSEVDGVGRAPADARRIGRALLMAAAGDGFAGGEDLDHGDQLDGPGL